MTARLTSAMLVSALVRRVADAGGAAVVAARGDATAGAILLICLEKGAFVSIRERLLTSDGSYAWRAAGPPPESTPTDVDSWLARRRQRDPDLWIIELDIPNAERFAAEMSGDN